MAEPAQIIGVVVETLATGTGFTIIVSELVNGIKQPIESINSIN